MIYQILLTGLVLGIASFAVAWVISDFKKPNYWIAGFGVGGLALAFICGVLLALLSIWRI